MNSPPSINYRAPTTASDGTAGDAPGDRGVGIRLVQSAVILVIALAAVVVGGTVIAVITGGDIHHRVERDVLPEFLRLQSALRMSRLAPDEPMTFAQANLATQSPLAPHVVIWHTPEQARFLLLVVRRHGTQIALVQFAADHGDSARSGTWSLEDVRRDFPAEAVRAAEDHALVLYR